MDRLKLFFPVRQSDDECGEKGKMEASAAAVAGGRLVVLASTLAPGYIGIG